MTNSTDPTTKMSPKDINQDHLQQNDQQRSEDSALDVLKGMHDHEDHEEDE